jgi:peptidoglycan/LPS O-acetylase OafA/YrhL
MQFYILSPFLVLIMYRYRKLGSILWSAILLACCSASFAMAYTHDLSLSYSFTGANTSGLVSHILDKPYYRAPCYLLGLLCAFLLIAMRWDRSSARVVFRRRLHAVGWLLTAGFMFLCVFGLSGSGGRLVHTESRMGNALWLATCRVLWGLALFWITLCCTTRQGGIVNAFLAAPVWLPASRLTYCAYLIHPLVLNTAFGSQPAPLYYSAPGIVLLYLGCSTMSYVAAAAVSVVVEGPLAALEHRFS